MSGFGFVGLDLEVLFEDRAISSGVRGVLIHRPNESDSFGRER